MKIYDIEITKEKLIKNNINKISLFNENGNDSIPPRLIVYYNDNDNEIFINNKYNIIDFINKLK